MIVSEDFAIRVLSDTLKDEIRPMCLRYVITCDARHNKDSIWWADYVPPGPMPLIIGRSIVKEHVAATRLSATNWGKEWLLSHSSQSHKIDIG